MTQALNNQMRILKHCLVMLLSLSPMMAVPTSFADDTEIFFGFTNPEDSNSKPNVLFLLDNSGSMNAGLLGSTRIQVMKDAFAAIINEVNGINAGVMQFTYKHGGAVNQSFLDLDATDYRREIPASSLANKPRQSAQQTLTAESNPTPPSQSLGTILDNGRVYTVTTNSGALGFAAGSGVETNFSARLASMGDDRSERYDEDDNSWTSVDSDGYLYFGPDSITGLRFQNVDIPATATIVSATISFTGHPQVDNNEQVDMQIRGLIHPNPPIFNRSTVPPGTIDAFWREQTTDANQRWSIGQRYLPGEPYQTSDFSGVIQEIIENGLWARDNTIMLLIRHDTATDTDGERTVHAYDRNNSLNRPVLNIQWIDDAEQVEILSGLHFSDVNIPQGAEIVSAALVLHAAADGDGDLSLRVSAEKTPNASLFPSGDNISTSGEGPLAELTKTTENVTWTIDVEWDNGSSYQSPDLAPIFQELVDQTTWCGGNSMNVLIEPNRSSNVAQRRFGASQNSAGLYPELRLAYKLPTGGQAPGCFRRASNRSISTDSDDAEENGAGTVDRNGANLSISQGNLIALRFDGISLVQGADVLQARLNVRAKETGVGPAVFNVWVENTGDSAPFVANTGSLSGRTRIGPVTWTVNENWNVGQNYSSGNIGLDALVERALAQSNWAPGQAITVFLQKASGADRVIYSHDDRANYAASLTLVADASDYATNISFSNKDVLISRVNNLRAVTWTPIVDTLYEAAMYYRGQGVDWGRKRLQDGWRTSSHAGIAGTLRVSHPDSYDGGSVRPQDCADSAESTCAMEEIRGSAVYESPIEADCQSNHIVLLTDGQANYNASQNRIQNLIGSSCASRPGGEMCAPELARFLKNNNQVSRYENSTVTTHTIAFALDPSNRGYQFMQALASAGGGRFTDARNLQELKDAFSNILTDIKEGASTFTQPSLSVNQFNQLYHRREMYFSMFQPSSSALWPGNVKGYRMEMQPDGSTRLVDAFGHLALDPATGYFKDTSRSYWSRGTDGDVVTRGGVVDNLPAPSGRRLFTYLERSLDDPSNRNLALTAAQNQFVENNPVFQAKPTLFGTPDIVEMRETVRWARGYDVLDADEDGERNESRFAIGDPLHSSPVMVTYGGNNDTPLDVLFVGNNDGFLRSIDATNGREIWGFLPEELLGLQGNLYRNQDLFRHPYGLDNTPVIWSYDAEKDGRIDDANDQVFLFATMRRGGRNMYALDVTDKDAPRMKWVIRGGEGDYVNLGQTWSTPVVTQIKIGDAPPRRVLIMGGGYDPAHDDDMNSMINSTMGNAVYIIDADTKELITHATKTVPTGTTGVAFPDMNHAFPAAPTTLDHDVDGLVDQIYIPDISGKLWRFDILNGESKENILQGGVIASLGGSPSTGGPRRFFSKVDLSLVPSGGRLMLAIAVGSGEVTSPLNTTIQNRFFVISQTSPFTTPTEYRTLYPDTHLVDITGGNVTGQPLAGGGYYRRLGPGEKITSQRSSSTINGTILFTTYTPGTSPRNACRAPEGTAKLYAMKVSNGQAGLDLNNDGNLTEADVSLTLKATTPPAAPSILILDDSRHPIVMVGTETPLEDLNGGGLKFIADDWQKVFWENQR